MLYRLISHRPLLLAGLCFLALSNAAMAFDSQSVLKLHNEMETMQRELQQIPKQIKIDMLSKPYETLAIKKMNALELQLQKLRFMLQDIERRLHQVDNHKMAKGEVVQRPLEDPFSAADGKTVVSADAAPLQKPTLLQNVAPLKKAAPLQKAAPLPLIPLPEADVATNEAQQELNTVPEILRQTTKTTSLELRAYIASNANGQNDGVLGQEAADILAFNQAKGYFDDGNYPLSERMFYQFIQNYPTSGLISNSYFWLGESYYLRQNYNAAARVFYRGFILKKTGAKAPDSLFKLAQSMLQLGNKSDACSALYEVSHRYSASHPALSSQAQAAQQKHDC